MVLQFQHLRGITTKVSSYVGLPGEILVDLTTKQLCLHDGSTVGGIRVAKDEVATASSRGLMSAADKQQLTNLASQVATLVEASQIPVADIQAGKDASGNTITTTYATKTELALAKQGLVQIVTSLPVSGVEGVIYLIETTAGSQTFNEYVWENNTFVPFGISKLDLSDYSKKSDTIKQLSISGKTITYTKGDNTTGTLTTQDTTYSVMSAATSSAAGKQGLVPAPAAGKQASFLRGDGTWVVPTNTTYSIMGAATSSAAGTAGLVPAPAAGKQASFLRGDGTWVVPTNNATAQNISTANATYPVLFGATADATANIGNKATYFCTGVKINPSTGILSANGFVGNVTGNCSGSAGSVAWSGITGKPSSYYTLPTASSSLGGVKTTSTVTSTSGLTACPIISGVVYYKDTNTTYSVATMSADGLMSKTDKANLDNLVSQMATLVTQVETLSDKVNTLLAQMDTYYTGYTEYPRS